MSTVTSSTSLRIATNTNENTKPLGNPLLLEDQKIMASIHGLPFELLSWTFELCSWKDWKSPLRISCVCTNWRHVVLNTPRAWCSTLVSFNKPIQDVYFERSGQGNLHVGCQFGRLPPMEVICRIKCMHIDEIRDADLFAGYFPNLERLFVDSIYLLRMHNAITASSFPVLRHLGILDLRMSRNLDCSLMPALESLSFHVCGGNTTWQALVQGCAASLTSLSIRVNSQYFQHNPMDLKLPKLHYLNIENPYGSNMSWLSITVPALRIYIDEYTIESKRCAIANGLRLITHLRLSELRSLDLLGDICALQIRSYITVYCELLDELMADKGNLPHLRNLQFFDGSWLDPDESERFGQGVEGWNAQRNPLVTLAFVKEWSKENPWNSGFPCGDESPCNPDK